MHPIKKPTNVVGDFEFSLLYFCFAFFAARCASNLACDLALSAFESAAYCLMFLLDAGLAMACELPKIGVIKMAADVKKANIFCMTNSMTDKKGRYCLTKIIHY
jgi:hypothetical protein